MIRRLFVPLLTLALLPACGIHSTLNQLDDEYEKSTEQVCSCSEIYPDKAACEAQFQQFNYFAQVDRDCLEDALKIDKDASEEALDCSLDHAKRYNDCLKDNLKCDDPNSINSCTAIFEEACPQLPEAVQMEVTKCGAGS